MPATYVALGMVRSRGLNSTLVPDRLNRRWTPKLSISKKQEAKTTEPARIPPWNEV